MFVVFEGIDGSGKTTLSNLVAKQLGASGLRVKHARADGRFASPVAESIRALGRDARNLPLVPKAELMLYVARELQMFEEIVRPALASHDVVIADRFLATPEVLGRFGRKLDTEFVSSLVGLAGAGLTPDLTLVIDVDPWLARARRRAGKSTKDVAKAPSRKGLAGRALQTRIRQGYLELAERSPESWVVINNDVPLGLNVERVTALIESARTLGPAAAVARFRGDGSAAPNRRTPARLTLATAFDTFRDWLTRRAEHEPGVAARLLSGFAGEPVDDLRVALAERAPEPLLLGLAGMVDEVSFYLRERHAVREPRALALGLHGVPATDARAHALRFAAISTAGAEVASSLGGDDSDAAFELRERLFAEHPEAVIASLGRMDSDRAWALRGRFLALHGSSWRSSYEFTHAVARSVKGLGSDRAWSLREAAREMAPVSALRSLSGLEDERSVAWRAQCLRRAPAPVMQSLGALRSAIAWELRAAVVAECQEALDGISGSEDAEAWSLRTHYADLWPSTVLSSLGMLADTERGTALVERQLAAHADQLGVLRHASAFFLGIHRAPAPPSL
jgi:dTMP kinase